MTEKIQLLYVDDEPCLLEIGKVYLERGGVYAVDTFTSASMALEQLNRDRYDAIISDYQMPEMDGISFLRQLKAAGNTTPFIIFTGKGREEVVIEALNNGADFYIQKGGELKSQFAELSNTIRYAISQRQVEEALRESEKKFRGIFDILNDGIHIHGITKDGKPGQFIEVNEVACQMLQYTYEELLGYGPLDLVNGNHHHLPSDTFGELSAIGHSIYETEYRRKDGSVIPVEINTHVVTLQGKRVHVSVVRDITWRKKAEQSLRESEDRFRTLARAALDGIMIHDGGIVIDCNQQFADLFEYDPEEIVGKIWLDFLMTAESRDMIVQWKQSGAYGTVDIIGIKKDGTRFYGETTSTSIFWQGKQHSIIHIRNITIRKENERILQEQKLELNAAYEQVSATEEELRINLDELTRQNHLLRERETQLRAILESTADGILAVDNKGEILHANQRFADIWSIPSPLMEHGNDGDLLDFVQGALTDPEMFLKKVRWLYNSDKTDSDTLEFKDGRVIKRYSVPMIMDGARIGRVWSFSDITDQKRAEVALRESEAIFRSVLETIPLACPDEQYREQISRELTRRIQHAFETQSSIEPMDVMVTCRDGVKIHNSCCSITLGDRKNSSDLILNECRGSEIFNDANKKLRQLTELTWHDIFNQVSITQGFNTLAMEESDPVKIQEYNSYVWQACERIREIIGFTRDYEKLGIICSGWQRIHRIIELSKVEVSFDGITFENQIPEDLEVYTDPIIRKVFSTLLENATRHGEDIATINISCSETGGDLIITCEDDGVGIPSEEKDQIFDTGFGKNTGVGLFMAREFLSISGLSIRETGIPGEGARFEILVPAGKFRFLLDEAKVCDIPPMVRMHDARARSIPGIRQVHHGGIDCFDQKGEMISLLYIDNDPTLLLLGKQYLEQWHGFEVTIAESAAEAIHLCSEKSYDAIISDYKMPKMNGIEFLKYLRGSGYTTPFILLIGKGGKNVVIDALKTGADFYLQKGGDPKVQFSSLAKKIHHAVSRNRTKKNLLESQKKVAEIIEFLPDATFAINTSGVVLAWNRAMEIMTGVSKEKMLNTGDYGYALPFYHERRPILIDLAIEYDENYEKSYVSIQKKEDKIIGHAFFSHLNDGLGLYGWGIASPLYDTAGNISGAIESIRDITEFKHQEEEIRQYSLELEERNMDLELVRTELAELNIELETRIISRTKEVEELLIQKDLVLDMIGHDLKTPLTPIKALLPVLLTNEQNPESREIISTLIKNSTLLCRHIEKVLVLARLNHGSPLVDLKKIMVRKVVDDVLTDLSFLIREKNLDVHNKVTEDLVCTMNLFHLETILINIVGNAIKYSDRGGDVLISGESDVDSNILTIHDTGIGMSPPDIVQAFDEFYRADTSRHERDSQGLGLSIVKKIVNLYQGTVHAESPGIGQGSTFIIRFPKNKF